MLHCRGRYCRSTALGAGSVLVAVACWLCSLTGLAAETKTCATPVARVVSIQGILEMRRQGQSQWEAVRRLDTALCAGDLLRTGRNSRGALVIPPESLLRIDQNTTVSVSSDNNETALVFSQDGQIPPLATELQNACGAGYVISRFPKKFKVYTPFTYAAVEGTEFLVAMSCTQTSSLSVFEGKVATQLLDDATSRVLVEAGQTATLGPGEPPAVKVLVKPTDAVQWTIFYPPVTERRFTAEETRGDCQAIAEDQRPACLLERAEDLLRAGQADQAEADIQELLALQPKNGDAQALRAVISLARNDKGTALASAQEATQLAPDSYLSWLALSYVEQAQFKLEDALKAARHATELAPSSALVKARIAELLMSLGRIREAEKVAQEAVSVYPAGSRGYTILGFVHLAQINTKAAREDFLNAIERDSTDPLPRLGLGLAIIRDGDLVAGREQIEIAVALDPTNSLIRSYVGKAYYEEDTKARDALASKQFGLAKQLDPKDPTPWFYDAILKETQNQPVNALEQLRTSIELNDNRAIYRSRLLVDEDSASRSISLATAYRDLGFDALAQNEAAQSINKDQGNYSAHRFLSDYYATQPRNQMARDSELLQAQLLQPLNLAPVQPRLAANAPSFFDYSTTLPVGLTDYSRLFASNGLQLEADGLVGTQDTAAGNIVLSGVANKLAFSVGAFHSHTDGFRTNDDQSLDVANAFLQLELSPETSVQAEYRNLSVELGDTTITFFDAANFDPTLRDTLRSQFIRLGLRHDFAPDSTVLVSYIHRNQTDVTHSPGFGFEFHTNDNIDLLELRHLWTSDQFSITEGISYMTGQQQDQSTIDPTLPPEESTSRINYLSGYVYSTLSPTRALQVTLGLSVDHYNDPVTDRDQINPKFGLIWAPNASTTVRAAALRVLKRSVVSSQTIEPTSVAGFNQFFSGINDINGVESRLYAVALSHRFASPLTGGINYSRRQVVLAPQFVGSASSVYFDESLARAYLYWTPHANIAASLGYEYEQLEPSESVLNPNLLSKATTQRVPIEVRIFRPSGLFFAHIFPPCASTIPLQMKSPNPVPISDFETNFVKSRVSNSSSIPTPSSFTLTTIVV